MAAYYRNSRAEIVHGEIHVGCFVHSSLLGGWIYPVQNAEMKVLYSPEWNGSDRRVLHAVAPVHVVRDSYRTMNDRDDL